MLTGSGAISGTGNELQNEIRGNGAGNTLDGGGGSDTLIGGAGNDLYITDGGETITEVSGEGTDTIRSSVTLTLGANLENLELTGSSAINASGNSGTNTLIGNAAGNSLDGGGGSDTLIGGAGNDVYITDGADAITEAAGQGTDTVRSSVTLTLGANVENLVLTGSSAINGTGNSLANALTGNSGANRLDGGGANDTLAGGTGADSFVFSSAAGATNVDTITDFSAIDDTILLDDAVFASLATGVLSVDAFIATTTGNAADASDRIIYESHTGRLFFDRDGTGAAAKVQFATIGANLSLTNADFLVF